MNIPTELWNLILTISRIDIDMYKSCIRVNKITSKVIKKIINQIPNEIELKINYSGTGKLHCKNCLNSQDCDPICDMVSSVYPERKWYGDTYKKRNSNIIKRGYCFVNISIKNMLSLTYIKYAFYGSDTDIYIHILVNELLDQNYKQKNNKVDIIYDITTRQFYYCYLKS